MIITCSYHIPIPHDKIVQWEYQKRRRLAVQYRPPETSGGDVRFDRALQLEESCCGLHQRPLRWGINLPVTQFKNSHVGCMILPTRNSHFSWARLNNGKRWLRIALAPISSPSIRLLWSDDFLNRGHSSRGGERADPGERIRPGHWGGDRIRDRWRGGR